MSQESDESNAGLDEGFIVPEMVVLDASSPVESYILDDESIPAIETLEFTITPVFKSVDAAEAFFQGNGVALAFVEYEERFFIAAFDGSLEEGQWVYSVVSPDDSETLSIALNYNNTSGIYSVEVDGVLSLDAVGYDLIHLEELPTFYGDSSASVLISEISINLTGTEESEESFEETEEDKFNRTSKLKEMKLAGGNRLTTRGGLLIRTKDAFRNKMDSMPARIKDLDKDMLVFVDNEFGDDANKGRWPEPLGANGPKKSIQAGIDAVPNGGAVIIMPGYGLYLGKLIFPENKRISFVPIGDLDIGEEEYVIRSLAKFRGIKKERLLAKYQNLKANNEN